MARKTTVQRAQQHRSLITHEQPKSPISEQFRTLRTNLQFSAVDQDLKSLIVTSSHPAEGKSLTAANLAVTFAQQGKKVLLVDSDMRKPSTHFTFRINNTMGLSNVLVGDFCLETVVQDSKVDNLDVLTCGPVPPNPAELIGSKAFAQLVEHAKKLYDMVIFDTPPVLAVTDSQVLSQYVDGVLLVVRSKVTDKNESVRAKNLLEQTHANMLGVVLNDRSIEKNSFYYYYGK
ncbi:CpsD/CapB family tyrosine-protein kinase [Alkalibacillus almallahensis]|uniref:CpsD/CapB family tyrosine-protein kinase n=1 Tax=Alkalibacillus almallahensis TaxID=1379154 RepID=UPI001FBBDDCD|nr:CpsD/CapB family tyrosine-protein kinase [Alkalibacillus almallahensis]NIK11804.1 capsular exopolysaccharide synthesis family protein [Alkalibacillus almallahensis]